MEKTNDIAAVVKELHECGEILIRLSKTLNGILTDQTEPPAKPAAKELTLTEVRAALMAKSRSGYREEVRELIKRYGVDNLKDIDPANYEALMKDAEVIGSA